MLESLGLSYELRTFLLALYSRFRSRYTHMTVEFSLVNLRGLAFKDRRLREGTVPIQRKRQGEFCMILHLLKSLFSQISSGDAHLTLEPLSSHDRCAEDWEYVGNVTCTTGASACVATEDLSARIERGDSIAIAGETHVVRGAQLQACCAVLLERSSPTTQASSSLAGFSNTAQNTVGRGQSCLPFLRCPCGATAQKVFGRKVNCSRVGPTIRSAHMEPKAIPGWLHHAPD